MPPSLPSFDNGIKRYDRSSPNRFVLDIINKLEFFMS